VFGVLLSSGYTLDSILDMTFEQIELTARCVHKHKIDMINMVLEPVASAFGAKKSSRKGQKRVSSQKKKPRTKEEQEAMEQHKLHQLSLLGIGVRDI
jgi:Tfp pilus assembly protein PilP